MRTEDHDIQWKRFTFFYDNNYEFFGILIDGKHSQELEKEILSKFEPLYVDLYDYKWELNTKLMDIINDYLGYV